MEFELADQDFSLTSKVHQGISIKTKIIDIKPLLCCSLIILDKADIIFSNYLIASKFLN